MRDARLGTLGLGVALALALAPARAVAQGAPAPRQQTAAPKEPPPPLFPRHRRGMYQNREGIDLVDATPQSPPLDIDDPGVPDKGEYEINLTTHADLAKAHKDVDLLFVDANYGIRLRVAGHDLPTQLKFEIPVRAAGVGDAPYSFGMGPATAGLKFNFSLDERSSLSLALYPQMEFEAPGTGSVEKDLAEPGQTLILPFLVGREFRHFLFVANGGVEKPLHDPGRTATTTFGVAIGRAFTRKVAGMMEIGNQSALDFASNHLTFLSVGVIRGVRNVVVYARLGHSLYSDDGSGHTYLGVGMKVTINPSRS
jgi:hypothetical protein